MRLMQHMLPGMLAHTGAAPAPVPAAAPVPQKMVVGAIMGAVGAIAAPIASIVNQPGINRANQAMAAHQTMQTEMLVADAERRRVAQMQMLKVGGIVAVGLLTIYLLFR